MSLAKALFRRPSQQVERSISAPYAFNDWAQQFTYGGLSYPFTPVSGTLQQNREEIGTDFRGFIEGAYRSNGVVFACMLTRQMHFAEARFKFRRQTSGRPGALFGTPELARLEVPWPNGTTGDLLARMIQDVDLAGNAFVRRTATGVERLRPDWVTIVLGGPGDAVIGDLNVEVLGYSYQPGGPGSGREPVSLRREEVAHWAPISDPEATFRGMSWLTPLVREILADSAAMTHKLKFFENGGTPNVVVSLNEKVTPEQAERTRQAFKERHAGLAGAYETMILGGGADAKVIGADLKQLDFKVTQGHGETRIAMAARVPPIIVGMSEGLDAATYSNYASARRHFADGTLSSLWRSAAGALASIINVPAGSELWYDSRDISFLQEDLKDEADIQATQATSISQLTSAGYTAESIIAAITANDWNLLVHSGLFSVQLHPPGANQAPPGPQALPTNGNGNGAAAPALPPAS